MFSKCVLCTGLIFRQLIFSSWINPDRSRPASAQSRYSLDNEVRIQKRQSTLSPEYNLDNIADLIVHNGTSSKQSDSPETSTSLMGLPENELKFKKHSKNHKNSTLVKKPVSDQERSSEGTESETIKFVDNKTPSSKQFTNSRPSSKPPTSYRPSSKPNTNSRPSSKPAGSTRPSSKPAGSTRPSSKPAGSTRPSSKLIAGSSFQPTNHNRTVSQTSLNSEGK